MGHVLLIDFVSIDILMAPPMFTTIAPALINFELVRSVAPHTA